MCEKAKWCIFGALAGMAVAAVVVATNKKVQQKISEGADAVTKKYEEIKTGAKNTIKNMKKKKPAAKSSTTKQ